MGFGFFHRSQRVLTNDFDIVGKGEGSFHVLFAFVKQTHAVGRVEMALLLGRGQQTCSLGNGSALGLEFQQSSFQTVESLLEPLSFHFLVVPHRPGVTGVRHCKHTYAKGQQHRRFGERPARGQREGQGGQRANTGEDGPITKDTEVTTHRPMRELTAHHAGDEHQNAPHQRRVFPFKAKGSEAHQQRPSHRCCRGDPRSRRSVVEGQILNEDAPNEHQKGRTETGESYAITVA